MFGEKKKYLMTAEMEGMRVDQALAIAEADISRQYLQKLLKEGRVWLGNKYLKPSFRVSASQEIVVDYPLPVKMDLEPVQMNLDIAYEDEFLMVVNKEAGVVVHPAEQGKFMGKSLVNAALAHVGEGLRGIGGVKRPGIVHRLDKDTSGLIIIAKTDLTHQRLVEMFKNRQIDKKYLALVIGNINEDHGQIKAPLGRHPVDRMKRAVGGLQSQEANTEFTVRERFSARLGHFTLTDITLHTGRTHQIRVHFQSIKHALLGDKLYGNAKLNEVFLRHCGLQRQFLHAYSLVFEHPITKKQVNLCIDLPDDLLKVLDYLRSL